MTTVAIMVTDEVIMIPMITMITMGDNKESTVGMRQKCNHMANRVIKGKSIRKCIVHYWDC